MATPAVTSFFERAEALLGYSSPNAAHQGAVRKLYKLLEREKEIASLLAHMEKAAKNPKLDTESQQKIQETHKELNQEFAKIETASKAAKTSDDAKNVLEDLKNLRDKITIRLAAFYPVKDGSARKKALANIEYEAIYRDKRRKLADVKKKLEDAGLPGVEDDVKELGIVLKAAKDLEPDYKGALTVLADAISCEDAVKHFDGSLSGFVEDVETKSRKVLKELLGDLSDKRTETEEVVDQYEENAGISDGRRIAEKRAAIATVIKDYVTASKAQAKDVKQKKATAIADLDKIKREVDCWNTRCDAIIDAIEKNGRIASVREKLDMLINIAPAAEISDVRSRYQDWATLWDTQQYDAAQEEFTGIEAAVDNLLVRYQDAYDEWNGYASEIAEYKEALRATAESNEVAKFLKNLIDVKIRNNLVQFRKYNEACKLVRAYDVVGSLKAITNSAENPDGAQFKSQELQSLAARAKTAAEMEKLLAETAVKITTLPDAQKPQYEDELKELQVIWRKLAGELKADAVWTLEKPQKDPAQLFQDVKDFGTRVDGYVDRVDQAVAGKASSAAAVPPHTKDSRAEEQEFERIKNEVKAALQRLNEDYGLLPDHYLLTKEPDLPGLNKRFKGIVDAAQQKKYDLAALRDIKNDCEKKIGDIKDELYLTRRRAQEHYDKFIENLNTQQKKSPGCGSLYARLRSQADDAVLLTKSTVPSLVESGENALQVSLPRDLDAGVTAYRQALDELDKVGAVLSSSSKHLAAFLPGRKADLENELKELRVREYKFDQGGLSPKELVSFKNFRTKVERAVDDANDLEKRQSGFGDRITEIRKDIGALKPYPPTLAENWRDHLAAAEKKSKQAERAAELDFELKTIEFAVKRAQDAEVREDMELAAQQAKFEPERQKAEYSGRKKAFEYGLKKDADQLYRTLDDDRCNLDLYRQMGRVFEDAEKLAKTENFGAANQQLAQALGLAKEFMENPTDEVTASRKELQRLNEEFGLAVVDFLTQLSDLKSKLVDIEKRHVLAPSPVASIQPLFSLFNARIFSGCVKYLTDVENETDIPQRIKQKEMGLRYMRLYETKLDSHTLLKYVEENPISPVSAAKLRRILTGLHGALLAS